MAIKPILKWAGAKTRITPKINEIISATNNNYSGYAEPFLGSAAVFLNLSDHKKYNTFYLNDINKDLINFYKYVIETQNPQNELKKLFNAVNNTKEKYIKLRSDFNNSTDEEMRAKLFLYLNRHCFNGLCRYNSSGYYNVPFGKYENPYFPEKEIIKFKELSENNEIKLYNLGFQDFFKQLPKNVIVYCDPPYAPINKTSFTKYSKEDFSESDQIKLRDSAISLDANSVVMISNHSTEFTIDLYKLADRIDYFDVKRFISANGDRKNAKELIAVYGLKQLHKYQSGKEI